jgi:hypothetical protein
VATKAEASRTRALADHDVEAKWDRVSSTTPTLAEDVKWRRCNGQLPTTVLGSDPTRRVEVPAAVPAVTR